MKEFAQCIQRASFPGLLKVLIVWPVFNLIEYFQFGQNQIFAFWKGDNLMIMMNNIENWSIWKGSEYDLLFCRAHQDLGAALSTILWFV